MKSTDDFEISQTKRSERGDVSTQLIDSIENTAV